MKKKPSFHIGDVLSLTESISEIEGMSPNDRLKLAAYLIITASGNDIQDPNFVGTPDRFKRSMSTLMLTDEEIQDELDNMQVEFPTTYGGMIFKKNIRVYSFCPHHILPVTYDMHIGYIPKQKKNGKKCGVLGASKLVRIADVLSRRMVLQEQLIMDIADHIQKKVNPAGIAIVMTGVHDCMRIRGVKQQNSTYDMSEMRGSFKQNKATRDEFFHMIMVG